MKKYLHISRWRASLTTAIGVAALGIASTAWAATEIQVWHALNEHNAKVFEGMVKSYNRSQSDVKVVLQDFYDVAALDEALNMFSVEQRPNLVQLLDTICFDDVAPILYIQSLYHIIVTSIMYE